jgi:hypothetical protein
LYPIVTLTTTSKMQQTIAANKRKFDDWMGTQGVFSRSLNSKLRRCWDCFLYLFSEWISWIKKHNFTFWLCRTVEHIADVTPKLAAAGKRDPTIPRDRIPKEFVKCYGN